MATVGIIELPLTKVVEIKNNDDAIIDILCDLKIPTLLNAVQNMVTRIQGPTLLIIADPKHDIFVLFLHKPPPHWQMEGFKYMAFVSPTLEAMVDYFAQWQREDSEDHLTFNVIQTIILLLQNRIKAKTSFTLLKQGPI